MNTNPLIDTLKAPGNLVENAKEKAQVASDVAKETAQKATDAAKETASKVGAAAKETAHKVSEAATEAAHKAGEVAKETAHRVGDAARESYVHVREGCEHTLSRTRTYVRENPVPALLGAFALGALLSYSLSSRRREPTFRERYVDDPLESIRDTVFAALAPVGKRLHNSYESAHHTAEDVLDNAHDQLSKRGKAWAKHLRNAGQHLKFW